MLLNDSSILETMNELLSAQEGDEMFYVERNEYTDNVQNLINES
jgi:hypothetical protein